MARACSSGLVSSIVDLKHKCACGSSGVGRMGLGTGGLDMINCIWRRFERTGFESKKLDFESPFGLSGLERIGFEPCGLEVSQSIWLERVHAKYQKSYGVVGPAGVFSGAKIGPFSKQLLGVISK